MNECEKIVTLNQSANPPAAGKAYTKAAINAGFKRFFVLKFSMGPSFPIIFYKSMICSTVACKKLI